MSIWIGVNFFNFVLEVQGGYKGCTSKTKFRTTKQYLFVHIQMSVHALPGLPLAWSRFVRELLQRQAMYSNLDEEDIDYGAPIILDTFGKLEPEVLYKDVAYLDACSKIGRFALTFRDRLANALKSRNEDELRTLLTEAATPEYDDNKWLSDYDRSLILATLENEMVTYNALLDRVGRLNVVPQTILGSSEHCKCREEVCVWQLPADSVAAGSSTDRVLMLDQTQDPVVWVADREGEQFIYHAWCFKLPDLLKLIMLNVANPYTKEKFSPHVVLALWQKYNLECRLVTRYLEGQGLKKEMTLPLPSAT